NTLFRGVCSAEGVAVKTVRPLNRGSFLEDYIFQPTTQFQNLVGPLSEAADGTKKRSGNILHVDKANERARLVFQHLIDVFDVGGYLLKRKVEGACHLNTDLLEEPLELKVPVRGKTIGSVEDDHSVESACEDGSARRRWIQHLREQCGL